MHSNVIVRQNGRRCFFLLSGVAIIIAVACHLISCAESGRITAAPVNRMISSINGEPVIPRQVNRIFIGEFAAAPDVAHIAHKLVMRVRDFINTDGRLSVVSDPAMAEVELTGSIIRIESQAVEFGPHREPLRRRLRMLAGVSLRDITKDRLIFADRPVQSFFTFSEVLQPITPEAIALDRAIEELAQRVSLQTVSGWYTERMSSVEKGR